MSSSINKGTEGNLSIYDIFMSKADPRALEWPLMDSPLPNLAILLFYLYFVRKGPEWMKDRQPFQLRNLLVFYNFALVGLSLYMLREFLAAGWFAGYSYGCQPVDYSDSPLAMRMVRVCWLFFFSKLIELFDTIFFILRKKFNQVSFLHVFHHTIMPITWWLGVKFVPGGFGTFHGAVNSLIHCVMYFYYALAAMGPHMQKYLSWKKYITNLQMVQFVVVFVHTSQLYFIDCDYPRAFVVMISSNALVFLGLFGNFYRQTYTMSKNFAKSVITGGVAVALGDQKSKAN